MKLLFLDFDGVIFNVSGCIYHRMKTGKERHPKWELDPVALSLIEHLLHEFDDMKVVVSSTWRLGTSLEELQLILGPKIGPKVIGTTPVHKGGYRGGEIKAFIERMPLPVEADDIIIIDDDRDMNPYMGNLFNTNSFNGFTATDLISIERYFKLSPFKRKMFRLKKSIVYNVDRTICKYRWKLKFKLQRIVGLILKFLGVKK